MKIDCFNEPSGCQDLLPLKNVSQQQVLVTSRSIARRDLLLRSSVARQSKFSKQSKAGCSKASRHSSQIVSSKGRAPSSSLVASAKIRLNPKSRATRSANVLFPDP